jgi:type I restriction enzyme S subunit
MRLGECCSKIGSGATPRGGNEVYLASGEVALVRSQNIYNDHFDRSGLVYLTPFHAQQLDNVVVQEGDILLNITGDSVARVCQVPKDVLPARVNQHVAIIRPRADKLNPRFLRFFLASPRMQEHMLALAASGATRNALTKGMIANFELPDISMNYQRSIADILGSIEDKMELNRRMNNILEAMARLIFKDWFLDFGPVRSKAEGGRAPELAPGIAALFPDALDDDDKPVGWRWGSLAQIARSPGRTVNPLELPAATPYIGLEHMPRRSIALAEWEGAGKVTSGKLEFKKGEFLFGKLRPYFHKVGVAPVDGICSTDIEVVQPILPEWSAFVLACISSDEFVAYTDQTSIGTKMPRTSWKEMRRYSVCLPTKEIASAFQLAVQPMIDRIVANVHENRTLAEIRDLLLPKLMSGDLEFAEVAKRIQAVA